LHAQGLPKEILTVDNHADGPYLYLRMLREGSPRSDDVARLLRMNKGNSSGLGIGCVSWDGAVHPDQFWRHEVLGNVRERKFSQIWNDLSNPLLAKLKDKGQYVKGRCASCQFLDVCGGNFRVRAQAATGDLWAPDPACYLTDDEIAATSLPTEPVPAEPTDE
jgi:radical SAM protein with 4Fe4S-binding SPASM domain